jgi:hypothetical protein
MFTYKIELGLGLKGMWQVANNYYWRWFMWTIDSSKSVNFWTSFPTCVMLLTLSLYIKVIRKFGKNKIFCCTIFLVFFLMNPIKQMVMPKDLVS